MRSRLAFLEPFRSEHKCVRMQALFRKGMQDCDAAAAAGRWVGRLSIWRGKWKHEGGRPEESELPHGVEEPLTPPEEGVMLEPEEAAEERSEKGETR
ncbi:hypothetical protein cyc_04684 [Cyclospora cayetanensis]|uniref:Uncharacterized protein n=1 Tax=Cyclospora cayetanensis TaxID=88456 RepID=A0A1D3CRG6_9EIME|nr:hypothetical protein cyc_04684 [Cyclospora cayetanensis]